MIVLDELKTETYKTKVVADCLKAIGAGKKTLIVLEDNNAFAVKSAANIAGAKSAQVGTHQHLRHNQLPTSSRGGKECRSEARGGVCIMKTAQDIIIAPIITEKSMSGISR